MNFEKGEIISDLWKTVMKTLYKKGDKSGCINYRGSSLVYAGSKLLSMMAFLVFEILHTKS